MGVVVRFVRGRRLCQIVGVAPQNWVWSKISHMLCTRYAAYHKVGNYNKHSTLILCWSIYAWIALFLVKIKILISSEGLNGDSCTQQAPLVLSTVYPWNPKKISMTVTGNKIYLT